MRFAPKINGGNFRCAFTTASGWGQLSQRLSKGRQIVRMEVAYGEVALGCLTVQSRARSAKVMLGGSTIRARCRDGGDGLLDVLMEPKISVNAGQRLTVTLR